MSLAEVGIPIPPSRSNLPGRQPNPRSRAGKIRALQVGESAWFRVKQSVLSGQAHAIVNAKGAAHGLAFVTRQERNGARIWRTA